MLKRWAWAQIKEPFKAWLKALALRLPLDKQQEIALKYKVPPYMVAEINTEMVNATIAEVDKFQP